MTSQNIGFGHIRDGKRNVNNHNSTYLQQNRIIFGKQLK
jgi:hypothetical protein